MKSVYFKYDKKYTDVEEFKEVLEKENPFLAISSIGTFPGDVAYITSRYKDKEDGHPAEHE